MRPRKHGVTREDGDGQSLCSCRFLFRVLGLHGPCPTVRAFVAELSLLPEGERLT